MESYPKQEMDLKLEAVNSKIDTSHREVMSELESHAKVHTQLLEQVKITNGQVSSLQLWKAGIVGGLSILTMVLLPILSWALYTIVTLDDRINEGVAQTLDGYEFELVE